MIETNRKAEHMAGESQWVTFKVGEDVYGFEIRYVREMLRLPEVRSVPGAAADNLGVTMLRSEVIPVFDLRRRFGMKSLCDHTAELAALLKARLQDHENWVAELKRSVVERREFTLTTDPRKCAFGKWYDSYQTDDPWLARMLRKFNDPHRRIHSIGAEVQKLQQEGRFDEALEKTESTTGMVLTDLRRLFGETIELVVEQGRPSLMVVATNSVSVGVAVDEIRAVVHSYESDIQSPDAIPGSETFPGLIGMLPIKGTDKFTVLLDPTQLYPQLDPAGREVAA